MIRPALRSLALTAAVCLLVSASATIAQQNSPYEVVTGAVKFPNGIRKQGDVLYIADGLSKTAIIPGGIRRLDLSTQTLTSVVSGLNVPNKIDLLEGAPGLLICTTWLECFRWDGAGAAVRLQTFNPGWVPGWQGSVISPTEAVVAIMASNRIWRFGLSGPGPVTAIAGNGAWSTGVGDGPALSTPLASPGGVARNPVDGLIYIAEQDSHKIRRVRDDGFTEVLSGNGWIGWCDGPTTLFGNCMWHAPNDLRFSPDGTLYILDAQNRGVWRVRDIATLGRNARPELVAQFPTIGRPSGFEPIADPTVFVTFAELSLVLRFGPAPAVPTPTATATAVPPTPVPPTSAPTSPAPTAAPPAATRTATPTPAGERTACFPVVNGNLQVPVP